MQRNSRLHLLEIGVLNMEMYLAYMDKNVEPNKLGFSRNWHS